MAKVQLGVIFGSPAASARIHHQRGAADEPCGQREVRRHPGVDPAKTASGIREGRRRIETYTPFDPNKVGIEAVALDVTPGLAAPLANRPGKGLFGTSLAGHGGAAEVCVIVMHGLRTARTARWKGCWNWRICRTRPRAWQAAPSAWTKS